MRRARLGADSRLFAGEHDVAQKWSRALHQHSLAHADGILYPPRHDPTRHAIALFDRAPVLIPIETLRWHDGGKLRTLLAEILDHYAFDLIETATLPPKKGPKPETQSGPFE